MTNYDVVDVSRDEVFQYVVHQSAAAAAVAAVADVSEILTVVYRLRTRIIYIYIRRHYGVLMRMRMYDIT